MKKSSTLFTFDFSACLKLCWKTKSTQRVQKSDWERMKSNRNLLCFTNENKKMFARVYCCCLDEDVTITIWRRMITNRQEIEWNESNTKLYTLKGKTSKNFPPTHFHAAARPTSKNILYHLIHESMWRNDFLRNFHFSSWNFRVYLIHIRTGRFFICQYLYLHKFYL